MNCVECHRPLGKWTGPSPVTGGAQLWLRHHEDGPNGPRCHDRNACANAAARNKPTLFEMTEPEPVVKLSADRRRTMRQHTALERGEHPLMGGKVRTDGETCGTCIHHVIQGGTSGRYHKCALRNTGGPATDIRVSWPGCVKWEIDP